MASQEKVTIIYHGHELQTDWESKDLLAYHLALDIEALTVMSHMFPYVVASDGSRTLKSLLKNE